MVRPPHPPIRHQHTVSTAQCGTVWGRSSYFSDFIRISLCKKSVKMLSFPSGSRTLEQTNKDIQRRIKKKKKEPLYQNTNFSLWTEPVWFLISPMIAAFPYPISPRPPPPHFRMCSQDRVLFFIKRSEVIRLPFQRPSRISAAIRPLPSIYRSLHWTSSLILWQPCHVTTNPYPSAPYTYSAFPQISINWIFIWFYLQVTLQIILDQCRSSAGRNSNYERSTLTPMKKVFTTLFFFLSRSFLHIFNSQA